MILRVRGAVGVMSGLLFSIMFSGVEVRRFCSSKFYTLFTLCIASTSLPHTAKKFDLFPEKKLLGISPISAFMCL
jgi:hypothetical protein